ncbi:TPA: hypothetical protein ACGGSJ_003586, partial [Vibrio cholerae]
SVIEITRCDLWLSLIIYEETLRKLNPFWVFLFCDNNWFFKDRCGMKQGCTEFSRCVVMMRFISNLS